MATHTSPLARAETLTTSEQLHAEMWALQRVGTTDEILYPTSGALEQVGLLATAFHDIGFQLSHEGPEEE